VDLRGREHSGDRPGEVDPDVRPRAGRKRRRERARRIETRAGKRRFDGDEEREQRCRGEPAERLPPRLARAREDGRHHREADRGFPQQRRERTGFSGDRDGEVHGRARHTLTGEGCCEQNAERAAERLEERVGQGIAGPDASEAPERERDGGVDVRARALGPRRVEDADRGRAHCGAHPAAANEGIRKRVARHAAQCRAGVFEQCREHAGRQHEDAEACRFHQVLGPFRARQHRSFDARARVRLPAWLTSPCARDSA
jgi:hypothetical protein